MNYAAVIMYNIEEDPPGEGRMDFAGRDCDDAEGALGYLREGLAKLRADGRSFIFAGIQTNVTVEQLMEMRGLPEEGMTDERPDQI